MLDVNIQIPYTTRPQMSRNTGPIYNKNPDPAYIKAKKAELDRFGAGLWGHTHEAVVGKLVVRACQFLGLREVDNIVDLAMNFEEDVAIMYNGVLSSICFCFPSSWVPAERVGMALSEIHGPVADNHHLVLSSDKLAKTMADPVLGSFKRQVWTITTNPRLSNHPFYRSDAEPTGIQDLYFRLETQTTAPMGDGITSLFFVKVDVVPLSNVWDQYGSQITDSINSMTDAVLDYKNLRRIRSLLKNI